MLHLRHLGSLKLWRQLHLVGIDLHPLICAALVLALEELPQRDDLGRASLLLHADPIHHALLGQTLPLHDAQLHLHVVVFRP